MQVWRDFAVSLLGWAADIRRSEAKRIHPFSGFLPLERLSKSGHLRGDAFQLTKIGGRGKVDDRASYVRFALSLSKGSHIR